MLDAAGIAQPGDTGKVKVENWVNSVRCRIPPGGALAEPIRNNPVCKLYLDRHLRSCDVSCRGREILKAKPMSLLEAPQAYQPQTCPTSFNQVRAGEEEVGPRAGVCS